MGWPVYINFVFSLSHSDFFLLICKSFVKFVSLNTVNLQKDFHQCNSANKIASPNTSFAYYKPEHKCHPNSHPVHVTT